MLMLRLLYLCLSVLVRLEMLFQSISISQVFVIHLHIQELPRQLTWFSVDWVIQVNERELSEESLISVWDLGYQTSSPQGY